MYLRLVSASAFLLLCVDPALADRQSYCAAYATDFANAQAKDKALWQHKYDISLQSCMASDSPVVVQAAAPPKKIEHPKVQTQQVIEPTPPEPLVAKLTKTSKRKPGSDDWNAYCAKKYTSFDVTTGMYHSFTGADHKCVVTNP